MINLYQLLAIVGTLLIAQSIVPQLKSVLISKNVTGLEMKYFMRLGLGASFMAIYSWFSLHDLIYTVLNIWTTLCTWTICCAIRYYRSNTCTAEDFSDCKNCKIKGCIITKDEIPSDPSGDDYISEQRELA